MGRASFQFEDELLSQCASWLEVDDRTHLLSRTACVDLYKYFCAHFQRPSLTKEEEEQFIRGGQLENRRFEAFLRSVEFISNAERSYNLTLNRFSDMLQNELPFGEGGQSSSRLRQFFDDGGGEQPSSHLRQFFHGVAPFVTLDGTTLSEHANNLLRRQQKSSGIYNRFKSSWWWVASLTEKYSGKRNEGKHHHLKRSRENGFIVRKNKLTGIESTDNEWEHHLDWATKDNPDGVPIVHGAVDQGMCGSCWAISALGSLEASVSRNTAWARYQEASEQVWDNVDLAVMAAQEIEYKSIDTAYLSVQELIDCDTKYNQGCQGGNPLLAFYFLHRYGVTSTSNYGPYTGIEGSCKHHKIDQPVATVSSWGILTPDDEHNLVEVLRYIG